MPSGKDSTPWGTIQKKKIICLVTLGTFAKLGLLLYMYVQKTRVAGLQFTTTKPTSLSH